MTVPKRNCVFVALGNTVGQDLVFRHYTSKVVVGTYTNTHNRDQKATNANGRKNLKK